MKPKKKNKQDATLRNNTARKKEISELRKRVKHLELLYAILADKWTKQHEDLWLAVIDLKIGISKVKRSERKILES